MVVEVVGCWKFSSGYRASQGRYGEGPGALGGSPIFGGHSDVEFSALLVHGYVGVYVGGYTK